MDKSEFICEQIYTHSSYSHLNQNGLWIKCPYHGGGNERTASLVINIFPPYFIGNFHCFGCHEKGNWDKLAQTLGLKGFKIDQKANVEFFSMDGIFDKQIENKSRLPNLRQMLDWPQATKWRNIEPLTMRAFKAKLSRSRKNSDFCPYFPVDCNGYVGGIFAHIDGEIDNKVWHSKYLNTPGKWSNISLFGYDLIKKEIYTNNHKIVWIVEGPRDVMWCYQQGLKAVGLIGSAVTDGKLKNLINLDADYYVIATDDDDAGRIASIKLKKAFKEVGIPYTRLELGGGEDPCSVDPEDLIEFNKTIERRVYGKENKQRSA